MNEIIKKLTDKNETISTMESCTGGYICNSITNCEGSSEVFSFSAITYSNLFKIKMGVSEDIISKYSVYSSECARSMAKAISIYANSTYGVGVTGKLNRTDRFNVSGEDNIVYFCIYDSKNDKYYDKKIIATEKSRLDNKKLVLLNIELMLKSMI